MRVLVTGSKGFIGGHVVEALNDRGCTVFGLDNKEIKDAVYDIRGQDFLEEYICKIAPQVVVHLAAFASVRNSALWPDDYWTNNTTGTIRLVQACKMSRTVERIVFASSGGTVYGKTDSLPIDASHPTFPEDIYGLSKLAGEHILRVMCRPAGIRYFSLRFPNVYGPGQDPYGEAGVVAIWTKQMLDGRQTIINGDGTQTRDFMYVGDVAREVERFSLGDYDPTPFITLSSGQFNIGTGLETSVNAIWSVLADLTDYPIAGVYGPAKAGEVMRVALKPTIPCETTPIIDGLKQTVEWFKKNGR